MRFSLDYGSYCDQEAGASLHHKGGEGNCLQRLSVMGCTRQYSTERGSAVRCHGLLPGHWGGSGAVEGRLQTEGDLVIMKKAR